MSFADSSICLSEILVRVHELLVCAASYFASRGFFLGDLRGNTPVR